MEGCHPPENIVYAEKEYTEILLNSKLEDAPNQEPMENKPNTSSDEDVDQEEERWFQTCPDKEIQPTVECPNLHEKYVSKTVLHAGIKGLRPKSHSVCTFTIESKVFLDCAFLEIIQSSSLFRENKLNPEMNLEIGSSDTEVERALELALMDMCEGEISEVILSATKREDKLMDQSIMPVPCVKCILKLSKVTSKSKLSDKHSSSFLNASEKDKYCAALREKEHGVELFKKKRYCDAFHRFASGVKIIMTSDSFLLKPEEKGFENADEEDLLLLYSTLCSNMAECQLKEGNPSQAITLCQKALVYDRCNVKALYRQASAAWALGDADQADSLLKTLLEIDPKNSAAKRLHLDVKAKIKIYEDNYASMMKQIFNN